MENRHKPWEVIIVGDVDQAASVGRLRSELEERGWFDEEQKHEHEQERAEAVEEPTAPEGLPPVYYKAAIAVLLLLLLLITILWLGVI